MIVDLRSDTVSRPTAGMREAMLQAPVGDDVYGEDPTVNELEAFAARLFGVEAALFCVSGTMSNQIAIRAQTQPNDEVICDRLSHIYLYEGGGLASNSLVSVRLIEGNRGRLTAEQVAAHINPDDVHFPVSRLVSLENTVNKAGGVCYDLDEIRRIKEVCLKHGLKLHLDGARLFNAIVAQGSDPQDFGRLFDSLSVCLSKGLGCPVGSLLLGSKELIRKARRIRKVMGGGWRQAGMLAAAGLYALQHHIERLQEDHRRAKLLGELLQAHPDVQEVYPVETNIVIAELRAPLKAHKWQAALKERGILISTFGERAIRMVTHLDIHDGHISFLSEVLPRFSIQKEHK
ncbi:threonine aldolase [Thermonema lapsum]|uniref:Threonine aldolase n=1 Tax=Thermonema lapsum TaxID=28195 RepID=A0A846MSE7_9BACT|nr:low-specificity L-threonine aldolase [Thermonema lapsum]NIK74516.1 threonine aldolase [Thermonema lapsum]